MDIKELTSDFAKPGRRILKSESMITDLHGFQRFYVAPLPPA
jgi:hypothetical protein